MVTEEGLFLIIDCELDVIVISDNKHNTLSGNSELLFAAIKLCNWVRNIAITESRYFLPVLNFSKYLVQVAIKVTLKKTLL